MLAPYLTEDDARLAARYAWQASAAIYSWYAEKTTEVPTVVEDWDEDWDKDDLIDRAVATGDEHGFKFTEACLREHSSDPRSIYLAAAVAWVGRLTPKA